MCTSAEHRLRDGEPVRLDAVPYDDPVARELVEQVQREYVVRYGGPDAAVVDPAEFAPPAGLFLVARVADAAVGCAGWRVLEPGLVEVKRVYVAPGHRRRGLAAVLMGALEESARRAGQRTMVLNTGPRQPEALGLYAALGYGPVPGFGAYACVPDAVFLGKPLGPQGAGRQEPTDDEERSWAW
jgi:GNAT superfamily N-acetyltransferase